MNNPLSAKEAFDHGFHGLPDPAELSQLSAARLAILLAQRDPPGRAAAILIEHELNMRLAKEQSGATWKAAVLGAIGGFAFAVMGPVLTSYLQKPDTGKSNTERTEGHTQPNGNVGVQAPATSQPKPISKPIQPASGATPAVATPNDGGATSNQK